ncbi:MAG: GDSL-type esterase/lipase family protein [Limisphaerales bacterium]
MVLSAATTVAAAELSFKADEVVAFIGSGDVAAAQHTGHIESILINAQPKMRCRNFGWEGDTVFAQPRDYNFPPLSNHLRNAGATMIFVQFGRMEAFAHPNELKGFPSAYETLLTNLLAITPKVVLVTPIPFERPADPLPNVSVQNDQLEAISKQIRSIAAKHRLPVVDLFAALRKNETDRLTDDGVQLTPRGHAIVAQAFARQLNLKAPLLSEGVAWSDAKLEKLRQLIISKNRLWFDYWRPQNWAFLAGDRTEQPSSRDHRDPKLRWFPKEMERFLALIADKENEISLAASDK